MRQRQARAGNVVHDVLRCLTAAVEEASDPVVLICDIDRACLRVHGWVCAFILTEIRITGSDVKVRSSSRSTCASDASVAPVVTGRTCGVAEVAYRQFDDAAKAGAWSKLRVGHVQLAPRRVDRQELLVKKTALHERGGARECFAIRADGRHDGLAAA